MKLKKDKSTAIIKNILYETAFQETKINLNKTFFSVLVNESTDISNSKLLCISVQYFSEQSGKVVQHLLQIYFFIRNEINMQNIIALGCDKCYGRKK